MTAAPLLPDIEIDEHADADAARAFFERDRLLSAYALADLDPASADASRWWLARTRGEVVAAVLLVEGLPFRPCFAMGDSSALAQLFREAVHEQRLIVATTPNARMAVESTYRFERVDLMQRMAVSLGTFVPRVAHRVERLGGDHVEDVIELYGHASRTYFTAARLEREIYFGIYAGDTLVSAAGTHVRSPKFGVAAVGNVLTRVAYRGRGMATSCTSAVTTAALEEHPDVVLNVRADNTPAISVYKALGYAMHAPFIEGPALRRTPWERITKSIWRRT